MSDPSTFLSAWTVAERTQDVDFLEANLTSDFLGVGPLGFALTKPEWIARHQSSGLRYETFGLDQINARIHGPTAIVTARQNAIGAFHGSPVPQYLRNTFVLLEHNGSWQLASVHMSFIAGTPGAPPMPATPPQAPPDEGQGR